MIRQADLLRMSHGRRTAPAAVIALAFMASLSASVVHAAPRHRHDNDKELVVSVRNAAELRALQDTGGIILDCIPGVGKMHVIATPEQEAAITRIGLPARVIDQNVQEAIERQTASVERGDPFADFFLDYHPYGDAATSATIHWYMNELTTRYPTLASMVDVGTTLEGRTIWGLRIHGSASTDNPGVVYFGCEHSREWVACTVPLYLATHLLENYATDAGIEDFVDNVEFFLIPVFNVDGYLYTWEAERYWRKNRRNNGDGTFGVDINRNWGEGWGGNGSSGVSSDETYRGPAPFSEPETQELRDFFIAHPNVRGQLDVHSFSQLILWPYGYTSTLPPDQDIYEEVGLGMQARIEAVYGRIYSAGPIFTAIYPVSGGSVDWTYAQRDIFSMSFECRPGGGGLRAFHLDPDEIIPNNEELLPAILHMTDSDWIRLPMRYRFPNGIPGELQAGSDTAFPVEVVEQTDTLAPGTVKLFYRYDAAGPFRENTLTPAGSQFIASLPATNCFSRPEFYFTAETTGGETVASPRGAPAEGVHSAHIATPGQTTIYSEALIANPGWTTEGSWAFGVPTGGGGDHGGPDPTAGHTGPNVYGYNLSGDYPPDLPQQHLTSTVIDCTGRHGVRLRYWRWLGVEQPAYDHALIRVSNNGVDWVTVWQNDAEIADSVWTQQTVDISAVADDQPTVFLRWTMGTTDVAWEYCGWNIDDIVLEASKCDTVSGDYNGDGSINAFDADAFENCFAGANVPPPSGCVVFDFDADADVDCDDWDQFKSAWNGGGSAPPLAVCEVFTAPTVDGLWKNRYVTFIPGFSQGQSQAFRVTPASNPVFPAAVGSSKWIGPPDANGVSRLQCTPDYGLHPPVPIHIADADIVPGAAYTIEATLDGVSFLPAVSMQTVPLWGDVVGEFDGSAWPPADGSIDVIDFVAVLDAFRGHPSAPPIEWCDLYPRVPDRFIDIQDATYGMDAFRGLPYPFDAPDDCP